MKPWCAHCDARRARRRDGICDACNAYRAKYGALPAWSVLVRRERRADEQRMVGALFARTGGV